MIRRSFATRLSSAGGAALVAAMACVLFAPAAAAAPVITFLDECPSGGSPPPTPGPDCTPQEGTVVRGARGIAFSVDAGPLNRMERVDLSILSTEEGIPSPRSPIRTWTWPDVATAPRNTGTLRYTWDSVNLTEHNGIYKIQVTASTHAPDSSSASSERKDLSVDNPPATPPRPVVLAANADGVSLEWSPAPEPDFLSFTLYRARTDTADQEPSSGDFVAIGTTQNTDAFDEVDADGAYWYRVQSTRRSVVTPQTGISSALSAASAEPGIVVTPTPSPPPPGSDPSGGGSRTPTPDPRRVSSPALTPRPLPRSTFRAPPVPDAPFSQVLPYDLPEDGDLDGLPQAADDPGPADGEDQGQGAVSAVAIGMFLVSAALVVGRVPA